MGENVYKKKRLKFNILRETKILEGIYNKLPSQDEVYKCVSLGGFSSIAFIKFTTNFTKINSMTASTLRIGKKHLTCIDRLHRAGKIKHCHFIVGSLMKNDSKLVRGYGYYDDLEKVCLKNNWQLTVLNNHAKIILFDTDTGKFVLETSSNLNENPKIEQFSFEKDENLYEMYYEMFIELSSK